MSDNELKAFVITVALVAVGLLAMRVFVNVDSIRNCAVSCDGKMFSFTNAHFNQPSSCRCMPQ